ncbi:protein of unknown function [Taphrina deformans PYCC 5710]|uniref:SnoaL-like domain-containing protein n=1 Tax=Taphrina deformans (strain PYCC 5710 / ATCC 11124 / CBS 356.35 / IMI 108563 / JCM 9778 / NBRC 8474) TaxID=1097556 RepID=R4XCJ4_TAPDE|nr:protein of unknown function [Taphrina deformans PYCC 5710]|eukprot:CCG83609.1 protein of unknown function [Taphrina deformans PYCC 5710]
MSTNTLPTRSPSSQEKEIIDEVLSLYQCKPSEKSYSHYAETAVFHDPVSIAKGKSSIMSQFNGMPKIFERSDTQKCDVLDDKTAPNDLKLDLTQHYVFKAGKKEKTLNSKITLKLNNGMIEHHEEEWDHKPNTDGDDGFFGHLNEYRKKLSAKVIEKTVTSDPSKV